MMTFFAFCFSMTFFTPGFTMTFFAFCFSFFVCFFFRFSFFGAKTGCNNPVGMVMPGGTSHTEYWLERISVSNNLVRVLSGKQALHPSCTP